jgi:GDP-L-fucose synthase
MPTNLYGPGDNYDLRNSHVLPALIRKVHEAKLAGHRSITVWGSGTPRREFLHTSDLADACVFLLGRYDGPDLVNVGCGEDVTIRELAETVCDVLGFTGSLEFDTSKPDGTPRKLLDISKIKALGWSPKIPLREGIADAYRWFCEHHHEARL